MQISEHNQATDHTMCTSEMSITGRSSWYVEPYPRPGELPWAVLTRSSSAAARVAALVCSTYFKAQATVTGAMATVNIPTAVQFGPLSYAPSLHENAAMSTGLPMLGAALGALAMAAM